MAGGGSSAYSVNGVAVELVGMKTAYGAARIASSHVKRSQP